MANFIFGATENSGANLKTGGANPNISPIIPFLKPPLIAMLIKEPRWWKGLLAVAYNASQILAGLRGSLRGVYGRRQRGIGGGEERGRNDTIRYDSRD